MCRCISQRSFGLSVKNTNEKSYCNNVLKHISVEDSSKRSQTDTVLILGRNKAETRQWDCLTQVEKAREEKEPSYNTGTDPSEGLVNVLKKIFKNGEDDRK
ncbi:unnamed protein product [Gulo gulo]|uniref:SGS domain-containing protein n=1 Tax=Gulo gulo TaxID=48420 RepID=A0A9X9LPG8_GULGU|nr:unnamed protein product [Gulo gulo]